MDNENKNLKSLQNSIRILGFVFFAMGFLFFILFLFSAPFAYNDAEGQFRFILFIASILFFITGNSMYVVFEKFKHDSRLLKYSIIGGFIFLLTVALFWVVTL